MKLTVSELEKRLAYLQRQGKIGPEDELQIVVHSDGETLRATSLKPPRNEKILLQTERGTFLQGGRFEDFPYV